MPRRPAAVPALAVLILAFAASSAWAEPVLVVGPEGAVTRDDPLLPPAALTGGPETTRPAERACATARSASRPLARLAARPTVSGALDRALAAGAIDEAQREEWQTNYRDARALTGRLSGTRRRELIATVAQVERLVRRGALSASRMPAAFLQLRRNAEFWRARSFPKAPQPERRPCAGAAGLGGARVSFTDDPVVFQWYPGQGLQIQPLATFGKANALWRQCQPDADAAAGPCKPEELRTLLDRMIGLAAARGGFVAWEYGFSFGGGSPPWVSGLAQGTAIQALTRGSALLSEPRYAEVAKRALGAFERKPPVGVSVPSGSGSGRHYLIYSFNSQLRVLNGFLQALVGVYDLAEATGDPRARRIFEAGDRAARRELRRYDTGAWSLYAAGGAESDLGYHRLVRDFLRSLCTRTKEGAYCAPAERFDRYLHERTRVSFPKPGPARSGQPASIRFGLSKLSCVTLRVRRAGKLVHVRTLVMPRGVRALAYTPPERGAYTVQVQARDLLDHFTRVERTLEVRPAKRAARRRADQG